MNERPSPATPPSPAPLVAASPAGLVASPPPADAAPPVSRGAAVAGVLALLVFGLVAVALVALVLGARSGAFGEASPPANPADFAYAEIAPAPPLALTDQDGRPFDLGSMLGRPVLVFFGYTHCPDVCPANVGIINEALAATGPGPRAVFVSIDPERDDVAAMKQYLRYLPPEYTGLTGTPDEVRRNADGWGVKYARIDQGSPDGYAMAHTADIFLVDAQGRLRAHFPFGTTSEPMAASLAELLAETPPPSEPPATQPPSAVLVSPAPASPPGATPTPAPGQTTAPVAGDLRPTIVSSSIWAGGASPVILTITDAAGTPLDGTIPVSVRVVGSDGAPAGPDVRATAIRPPGESVTSFVAILDIPSAGSWRLDTVAADGRAGAEQAQVLDPGATTPLGGPAPDVDTPTLDDVGGNAIAITTQPQPDLRLSQTSTADARAAGRPYVLVIDSARFKVSPACGRALAMVRYLLDRWTDVAFIHLEPFEYQIITSEPVLSGDIANPPLNRYARAFGLGDATWPATRMPWIFVVDGDGIVRAKYTGIVGSADVDVILSLIGGEGVVGG